MGKLRPLIITALLPIISFEIAILPSVPLWKYPISLIGIVVVLLASYYEIFKPAKKWEQNRELICEKLFRPYIEELRKELYWSPQPGQ